MKLGIVNETNEREARVAMTPDVAAKLIKKGHSLAIESGAGNRANYSNEDYSEVGVEVLETSAQVRDWATTLLRIHPNDIETSLRSNQLLICNIYPGTNGELVEALQKTNGTAMALDCVPRITRAQKCDVRSSMDNIAGYRAVIEAANAYSGFFGGQMTAAGKSAPATVLIIGAGVAGLAAIGAARGLGAEVRAFDVREAAREQVQSMGAEFIQVQLEESGDGGGGYAKVMSEEYHNAQMALFLQQAAEVDIVISTANIPGRKAPILWEKRHVEAMRSGSVIVDLAAARGGNCELTQSGQTIVHNGVSVIGFTDLNSRMAQISSRFFAMNLFHLLDEIGDVEQDESTGKFALDMENEIVRHATVLDNGELIWPPPRIEPSPPRESAKEDEVSLATIDPKEPSGAWRPILGIALAMIFGLIGVGAPEVFVQQFTVFVLSCFIGWQVIWNVSHSLHTPLMSVTNAISGIIIVGGMLQLGGLDLSNTSSTGSLAAILGIIAILFAAINVAGGFLVTQRMLAMFRRGDS
ncbi:MAG: NAD(P)(+) transhydrogenase (Re/Si-specific) subunit alpha [Deltaproteobacteria bacterium]|nr:NAD(P)(+) transhydrogenase (Re/Si-specific) subunit alpha [Deltaproteobacteria bacterium]